MKIKDLILFLTLELLAVAIAGLAFALIQNKIVAGGVAGAYFVISGLYMLARANRWPGRWSAPTWYCLLVHVFGISLPMLASRFLQLNSNFSDVRVFGLPGPVFHQLSTSVFTALIVATLIDGFRGWRAERASVS